MTLTLGHNRKKPTAKKSRLKATGVSLNILVDELEDQTLQLIPSDTFPPEEQCQAPTFAIEAQQGISSSPNIAEARTSSLRPSHQTSPESSRKTVEIGHFVLGKRGDELHTSGIGSCVGVVLWDRWHDIAGMIHIQFPSQDLNEDWTSMPHKPSSINPSLSRIQSATPGKCANTGLLEMFEVMRFWGANSIFTKAYLAGGSNMFPSTPSQDRAFDIGWQNLKGVRSFLKTENITIKKEDSGGHNGRSMSFDVSSGKLHVNTLRRNHG